MYVLALGIGSKFTKEVKDIKYDNKKGKASM